MTETSATKPPQLRAARARKQSIIKFVILFVTLAFLFVPLLAMLIFTLRHPLSGRWSAAPWIAIFTGNGESLGADLTVLWQGIGTSLALSAVTVVIMLVLLVPTMVIVHIRSKVLERAIEWVATLPLTIPAIVLVVGLGPIYRWLSADVLSTNPIWLCFAYVILVMPFAFRAIAVGLNSIDVKTLVEKFGTENLPAVAVFGEGTLRAALDAGITVLANAPTPEAPSMAKAIDIYLNKVQKGEEIAPVELITDTQKEEFIRSQQHKLAKKSRARRPADPRK